VPNFSCLACAQKTGHLILADCKDYYLGTRFHVDYWKCDGCGLVQQSPLPADTSPFYANYPIHSQKSFIFTLFRKLLMTGAYYPAKSADTRQRLLDFGCGDGWFLENCKSKNFDLIGYEPQPAHASRLSARLGIPVEANVEKLLSENGGQIDILTMNFVMEHLTDLNLVFAQARQLIRPGGLFYFSVPDFNSIERRIFGKKWHNIDAPRHISFPDAPVIDQLAARNGFRVVKSRGLPFLSGFAASIPVVLTGRFRYWLFLASIPAAYLFNLVWPTSCRGYWLEAIAATPE
jgi:SAM-dependent methyltransferase